MKSRYNIAKSFAMAAAATVAMTACTDFDYNEAYSSSAAQAFSASFIQQYGEVDPENDFNTAESNTANVTINYSGTFTFEVYTADPYEAEEQSYLLARYKDLAGDGASYEFNVDAPQMFTTLYAALTSDKGGTVVKTVQVKNGVMAVEFGAPLEGQTRAFSVDNSGNKFSITSETAQFTRDYLNAIQENMPEGQNTTSNNDYELVSNGPFTIYPIYSQTSGQDELGIYYYNPATETQSDAHIVTVIPDVNNSTTFPKGTSYWTKSNMNDNAYYNIDVYGLTINIPVGYRLGMYLKNRAYGSDGYISQSEDMTAANTFFSAQSLNLGQSYSAFYKSPTFFLLGLEDWKLSVGGDNDCNDFIFSVIAPPEGRVPDVVRLDSIITTRTETHTESITRSTAMGYVIAFEDLGSTDDSDFNDIVLRLNHVSGEEDATVELLAAGGTMETYILYGDEVLWGGKEVHKLYGVDQSKMVNTGWYSASNPSPTTIKVGADFKIKNAAKDFHIRVTAKDGSGVQTTVSVPYTKGIVPQALLIADPNWVWPEERVNVGTAYPAFSTFVSNYRDGLSWYNVTWAGNGSNTATIGEETTVTYDTTYTITITETTYTTINEGGNSGQTVELVNGVNDLFTYRAADETNTVYTFKYTVPDGYEVLTATLNVETAQNATVQYASTNGNVSYALNWGNPARSYSQQLRTYGTSEDAWANDDFGHTDGEFTLTTQYPNVLSDVSLNVKLKKVAGSYAGQTRSIYQGENDITEYRKLVTLANGRKGYQFKYSPAISGVQIASANIVVEFEQDLGTQVTFYQRDNLTDAKAYMYGTNHTLAWNSTDFKNGFTLELPYLLNITEIKSVKLTDVVYKDLRQPFAIDFASLFQDAKETWPAKQSTFTANGVTYNTYEFGGTTYDYLGFELIEGRDNGWWLHRYDKDGNEGGLYAQLNGTRRMAIRKAYAGQYVYLNTSISRESITYSNCELSLESRFSTDNFAIYRIVSTDDEAVVFNIPKGTHIYYVAILNEFKKIEEL